MPRHPPASSTLLLPAVCCRQRHPALSPTVCPCLHRHPLPLPASLLLLLFLLCLICSLPVPVLSFKPDAVPPAEQILEPASPPSSAASPLHSFHLNQAEGDQELRRPALSRADERRELQLQTQPDTPAQKTERPSAAAEKDYAARSTVGSAAALAALTESGEGEEAAAAGEGSFWLFELLMVCALIPSLIGLQRRKQYVMQLHHRRLDRMVNS